MKHLKKHQRKHLKPAQYVVKVFGGVRPLAKAIGRNASCVSRWNVAKTKQGCAGRVPLSAQILILKYARRHHLDINATDLIEGRRVR